MSEKINIKAYIAWGMVSTIWGTTYLAIRVGVQDLPPFLFAGFRWIIAGVLFFSYLYWRGNRLPKKSELKYLLITGISLIGISNGLVVVAEQWIPSGLAALLMTTLPFWVAGYESFLPEGIKFNTRLLIGLLMGFLGISIIFSNEYDKLLNPDYLTGIVFILISMFSWTYGSIYSKYKKIDLNPLVIATLHMIIAGVFQTSIGLALGEFSEFHFTTNSLYAFLYLILVGSMFGYGSFIYAITHLPVSFVSTYSYINPIIALILGWLILDEQITWPIIIAAGVILIGVAIIKSGSITKPKKN